MLKRSIKIRPVQKNFPNKNLKTSLQSRTQSNAYSQVGVGNPNLRIGIALGTRLTSLQFHCELTVMSYVRVARVDAWILRVSVEQLRALF